MAVSASRCPHCTTDFPADVVSKRQRDHWLGMAGGGLILLIGIILLARCADQSEQDTHAQDNAAAAVGPTTSGTPVRRESAQPLPKIAAVSLPKGAPEAPSVSFCPEDGSQCDVARLTIERRDWPLAWKGDYQGQRNVAYCLKTGCDGGVHINHVAACAWRQIIVSSGNHEVDDGDLANLNGDCGSLNDAGRTAAKAQAGEFFKQIYGRTIEEM